MCCRGWSSQTSGGPTTDGRHAEAPCYPAMRSLLRVRQIAALKAVGVRLKL